MTTNGPKDRRGPRRALRRRRFPWRVRPGRVGGRAARRGGCRRTTVEFAITLIVGGPAQWRPHGVSSPGCSTSLPRSPGPTRPDAGRPPMPSDLLLPGISATQVATDRLGQQVLHPTAVDPYGGGEAVLFVHGNVSSAAFWQPQLLALDGGRRPLAVDLRGFGGTDPLPVDARRGVRDWADDLAALVGALELDRVHLVGWSMGAGVVLQYLLDVPQRVASVTLVAPVSPYGFGGTTGHDGQRVHPDGTGSGGGAANPEFVAALAAGDTTADTPTSPRSILRACYVAPGSLPLDPRLEDVFVGAMLTTRTGVDHYPGDAVPVPTWPGMAPGGRGVLNTMAPTVMDLSGITELPVKPPVLWVRGDADVI